MKIYERHVVLNASEFVQKVFTNWGGAYNDLYDEHFVYRGKCGADDTTHLCLSTADGSCDASVIVNDFVGSGSVIWNNTVAWAEDAGLDIRAYRIDSSEFVEVTNDSECQMKPRVHGNRIVYQDLRFGDNDPMGNWNHSAVFMYDLDTEETTQIAGGDWIACYPDVHDDIIVWQDYRASTDPNNGNDFSGVEIWGYNLTTETEFQITNLPGRAKQSPRIWQDKVYVHMAKGAPGENAIYRFDIPPEGR